MAINWDKPAGTAVNAARAKAASGLAAARTRANLLLDILEASPRLSVGAGATAILSTFFLKNDDRGYAKTSLITTPIVVSAAMVGPKLFETMQAELPKLRNSLRAAPAVKSYRRAQNFEDLMRFKGLYERGEMAPRTYESLLASFYAGRPEKEVDLVREQTALNGMFEKLIANPAKHQMVANAIRAEKYRTMSAAQLAQEFGRNEAMPEGEALVQWMSNEVRRPELFDNQVPLALQTQNPLARGPATTHSMLSVLGQFPPRCSPRPAKPKSSRASATARVFIRSAAMLSAAMPVSYL
jgi:hypothetical protein